MKDMQPNPVWDSSVNHPYVFDRGTGAWPDDLWSCPGCGQLRSDPPWNWTRHDALRYWPHLLEVLEYWPPDFVICRDCNSSGFKAGERAKLFNDARRLQGLSRDRYLRIWIRSVRRVRRRWLILDSKRRNAKDSVYIAALVNHHRSFEWLVRLEQLWFLNHPEDYTSTWSRAFIANPRSISDERFAAVIEEMKLSETS